MGACASRVHVCHHNYSIYRPGVGNLPKDHSTQIAPVGWLRINARSSKCGHASVYFDPIRSSFC